jgi:protoporphyrinogen oxidase
LISTIPLGALMKILPPTPEPSPPLGDRLIYRSLICLFLAIDGARLSRDTWTYFSDPSIIFGRIHEPLNWSVQLAPPGKTSLALEIFCSAGDALWDKSDNELIEIALHDLARLKIIERARVENAWLARIPNAYPLYKIGYQEHLARVHEYLTRWNTLHLVGRTGAFQYMNSDGVIKHALDLADALVPQNGT